MVTVIAPLEEGVESIDLSLKNRGIFCKYLTAK